MAIPAGGIVDPSDRETLHDAFIDTYSGYDRDPHFIVSTWRRYQDYLIEHPDAGSAKIANALEVPRSMLRRWVDDNAIPYVVQGVQTLRTREWDGLEWRGDTFAALNRLVAWIFSSGSIHDDRFTPSFVVDDDDDLARLQQLADSLVVGLATIDTDPNRDRAQRGEIVTFDTNAAILGRLLAVLGAPVGQKRTRADIQLPRYLDRAPEDVRRAFAQTYVINRARTDDDATVTFGEDRPDAYADALVALLRDVTGERVVRSGIDVAVSKAAAEALGLDPYTARPVEHTPGGLE